MLHFLNSPRGSIGLVRLIGRKGYYYRFRFILPFYNSIRKDTEYTYVSEIENFKKFEYFKKETNA